MYFCLSMMRLYSLLIILGSGLSGFAQSAEQTPAPHLRTYEFIPNHGQWHPLVKHKADIPYGYLALESDALHYNLASVADYDRIRAWQHAHPAQVTTQSPRMHSVRMRFLGVEYAPILEREKVQQHYYNYFIGNDESRWASELYPAQKLIYKNVYADINLELLGDRGLKYQWVIIRPNTEKITQIRLSVEGADKVALIDGQLEIHTSTGIIKEDKLVVYQNIGDARVEINARYKLEGSVVSYEVLGTYNNEYPLIIDPELIFSTYSGSTADNFGYTATYDSKANLYAGGMVSVIPANNEHYPVTSGAYDLSYNEGDGGFPCDVSISKYDSAGSMLLWATYLGGEQNEYPHSLVVDRNDELVILGTTSSYNFPVDTLGYDTTIDGGVDIYVAKLSEDGSSLVGSTFIGGRLDDGLNQNAALRAMYADDFRGDVITDDDNNIYVATTTFSDDMPTVNAFQTTKGVGYDGYIFELSPDIHTLKWATYLGGDGIDAFYSIKLDQQNSIYIGGGTTSSDLPATDTAIGPSALGGADGVLAIIHKHTKQLKRLTYWGTAEYDQIYFIDRDVEGRLYATGQTSGSITKSSGVYGESDKGQFVFRIDTLFQEIDFITTFGNTIQTPNLAPSAFLVDVCGHIYFSGWGSDIDASDLTTFPGSTDNMVVSDDAVQKTTDGNDFYIIVFGRDAQNLLYATYFGGDVTGDHVDGGTSRFDKRGVMYQSVCASCPPSTDGQRREVSDFPTTTGAAFELNPSVRCSNASFKIDLQIREAVIADFVAAPTVGCAPHDVQFTSTSVLGDSFLWDFDDGVTTTELNPLHTFEQPGTYTVTLTVIDSATCNILSTYKRTVEVIDQGTANFEASFNGCDNKLSIENLSERAFSYRWDFGDGNTSTSASPVHQYEDAGNYTMRLYINENSLCADDHAQFINVEFKSTPTITLYNVFTPNGDGVNDCFIMDGEFLECIEYDLKIYNRWGELVFRTDNPNECWAGNHYRKKQTLPSSTYYYILHLGKSKDDPISGVVELIRE
jgi:gliding motility-associated-like protein